MDWDSIRGEKGRPATAPPLKLLETCWRIKTPSGRVCTGASTGRRVSASRCAPASARMTSCSRSGRPKSAVRASSPKSGDKAVLAKGWLRGTVDSKIALGWCRENGLNAFGVIEQHQRI